MRLQERQTTRATEEGKIRIWLILTLLILVPALIFAAYTYTALHWSYSDGERAGYLQKFSRKGWICKTYEGDLAMTTVPGVAPIIWSFSVRDEKVAAQIKDAIGRKVALHYTEHRGIPGPFFGETNYFVDSVIVQE